MPSEQIQPRTSPDGSIGILMVAGLLVLVGVVGTLWYSQHSAAQRQAEQARQLAQQRELALRELAQQAQAQTTEARRQMAESGTFDPGSAAAERTVAALERAAEKLTDLPKLQAQGWAKVLAALKDPLEKYDVASNAFARAAGVDPSALREKTDVAQQLARVQDFRNANEQLMFALEKVPNLLRQELTALNYPADQVDAAVRAITANFKLDTKLKLRRSETQMIDLVAQMLGLLERHWGAWYFDPSTQAPLFENQEAGKAFRQLADSVGAVLQEQSRLQAQIVAPPQAPGKP